MNILDVALGALEDLDVPKQTIPTIARSHSLSGGHYNIKAGFRALGRTVNWGHSLTGSRSAETNILLNTTMSAMSRIA